MRKKSAELFRDAQNRICSALEACDGKARFMSDIWERPDLTSSWGGGGDTRVIAHGAVFEKAGVNFSEVQGTLPRDMSFKLVALDDAAPFFATGISIVIHPLSPMVPTTHMNFRYLEVADKAWFGGGMDLTPYYLFEEDATHFHRTIKAVCDRHPVADYRKSKRECDEYFFLPHRGEARGIGGIFFDYLGRDGREALEPIYRFVHDATHSFLDCYLPIVERRKTLSWGEHKKRFQLIRRGRYVEFNLLYDRGTQFGLKTGGRTESILMSLPPEVRWDYNFTPEEGSTETKLLDILRNPREWV